MQERKDLVAFVTGASRGIGAVPGPYRPFEKLGGIRTLDGSAPHRPATAERR